MSETAPKAVEAQPAVEATAVAVAAPVLNIDVIRINKTNSGKLRGFVDIKVNEVLTLKGFKVFEGKDGLFVSPPSHKSKTDASKWYSDIFIEGPDYKNLQDVVLGKYNA